MIRLRYIRRTRSCDSPHSEAASTLATRLLVIFSSSGSAVCLRLFAKFRALCGFAEDSRENPLPPPKWHTISRIQWSSINLSSDENQQPGA